MLTIELPIEIEQRAAAAARAKGVSVEAALARIEAGNKPIPLAEIGHKRAVYEA